MIQDPLIWDWSIYPEQSIIDLKSLKTIDSASHLVVVKMSSNAENLCLLDVKRSSSKRKLPVVYWTICRYDNGWIKSVRANDGFSD